MIKLTKAQRDQLIAVAIGAVAIMAALWYLVIVAQGKELAVVQANCKTMRTKLDAASDKVKQAEEKNLELTNCLATLHQREATFAPAHEPYSWMVEVMARFSLPAEEVLRYKSVSNIEPKPPEISDKGVIAGFPYKWARFHITGQGHYHDFGKFVADFENAFPYFSIQNLEISVPGIRQAQDPDMLAYSFDVVTPQLSSGAETK
jgi:Tfp pilus assembly protein PilO